MPRSPIQIFDSLILAIWHSVFLDDGERREWRASNCENCTRSLLEFDLCLEVFDQMVYVSMKNGAVSAFENENRIFGNSITFEVVANFYSIFDQERIRMWIRGTLSTMDIALAITVSLELQSINVISLRKGTEKGRESESEMDGKNCSPN